MLLSRKKRKSRLKLNENIKAIFKKKRENWTDQNFFAVIYRNHACILIVKITTFDAQFYDIS